MAEALIAIVADRTDALALNVARRLTDRVEKVAVYEPSVLASVPASVSPYEFTVEDCPVACVMWRVTPQMSLGADFTAEDRSFASAETAAAWLSALNLPRVFAINRYTAALWYGGCQWPAWHTWLRRQGVPVAELNLGVPPGEGEMRWLPYLAHTLCPVPQAEAAGAMGIATVHVKPAFNVTLVAGEPLAACASYSVCVAAAVLRAAGIILARLTIDECDRILFLDPVPSFSGKEEELVAERLAEVVHAGLRAR